MESTIADVDDVILFFCQFVHVFVSDFKIFAFASLVLIYYQKPKNWLLPLTGESLSVSAFLKKE